MLKELHLMGCSGPMNSLCRWPLCFHPFMETALVRQRRETMAERKTLAFYRVFVFTTSS